MADTVKVFICGTYRDQQQEREGVLDAIRKLQLQHDSMEYFGARTDQPIETCLTEVRRSDVLVVVLSHLYGDIVPGMAISFSEAEYNEGYRLKKPCLVYLKSDDVQVSLKDVERDPDKLALLRRFKDTLLQRHTVNIFENDRDLSVQVAADLSRLIHEIGKTDSIGDIQAETFAEHKAFISHSHADSGIASRLIDVIETYLQVPAGTIKCTSVPDYELDLGALTSEELSRELNSVELVIALLTPNSINAEWVLFELGAAWGRNCTTVPLFTGGLTTSDLPGPLKGRNAGRLEEIGVLRQLVDNVGKITGWQTNKPRNAETKMEALISYLNSLEWSRQQNHSLEMPRTLLRDFEISYLARKNRLPGRQRELLEIIEKGTTPDQWIHQKVIKERFGSSDPYWRLEHLFCLGFLEKRASGAMVMGVETFNYNLTLEYRQELAETYSETY